MTLLDSFSSPLPFSPTWSDHEYVKGNKLHSRGTPNGPPNFTLALYMKMLSLEFVIGLNLVILIAVVTFIARGFDGVLYVAMLWGVGCLVLFLWEKKSRAAKVLAVILMPAVLLTYLLPRKLKRAIQHIEKTKH
jgi:hypothetical protein